MNKEQRERLIQAMDIIEILGQEQEEKLMRMMNMSETPRFQKIEEEKDALEEVLDSLRTLLE